MAEVADINKVEYEGDRIHVEEFPDDGIIQIWLGPNEPDQGTGEKSEYKHSEFLTDLITIDYDQNGNVYGIQLLGSAARELKEALGG